MSFVVLNDMDSYKFSLESKKKQLAITPPGQKLLCIHTS